MIIRSRSGESEEKTTAAATAAEEEGKCERESRERERGERVGSKGKGCSEVELGYLFGAE